MTTVHDPLDFISGDTWPIMGWLENGVGDPLDLNGCLIVWTLTPSDSDDPIITLNNFTDGGITILDLETAKVLVSVQPEDSAAIPSGIYTDWMRVELADGSIFTEWTGAIRVAPNPA